MHDGKKVRRMTAGSPDHFMDNDKYTEMEAHILSTFLTKEWKKCKNKKKIKKQERKRSHITIHMKCMMICLIEIDDQTWEK